MARRKKIYKAYQGGGEFLGAPFSKLKQHVSAGGGQLGLKNLNLGQGFKGNLSAGLDSVKAGFNKTFARPGGRNLNVFGSGSLGGGKGFTANLGFKKTFNRGGTRGCFECGGHYEGGGYVPFMPDPEFLEGGVATPLPGGAVEFTGRTHKEGGIMVDERTEVENGETMDKVKGRDYFFSNYLKLGGKTFSERHKQILAAGGSQQQIDELADIQEAVAGRDKYDLGGERNYQGGGYPFYDSDIQSPDSPFYTTSHDPDGPRGSSVLYYYYDPNDVSAERTFTSRADMEAHMKETGVSDYYPNIRSSANDASNYGFPEIEGEEVQHWDDFDGEGDDPDRASNMSRLFPDPDPDPDPYKGLYNKVSMDDITPYLDEARRISGYDDFDPTNPDHVSSLQNNMILLSRGLNIHGVDVDPTMIGGTEEEYLSGEKTVHSEPQNIDGKFGRDTLNALMEQSDAIREGEQNPCEDGYILDENGDCVLIETEELDIPAESEEDPCPCDERLHASDEDCCAEEEVVEETVCPEGQVWDPETETCVPVVAEDKKQGDTPDTPGYNVPDKPFPWDTVLGVGAAAAQLLPAYMAFREKPDYMGAPGRIPTTHLDRVAFNDAFAANAANYRGMGRFIEQSGLGPGGISNRMAAWRAKQAGDAKIEGDEARQNAIIANQESVINQQSRLHNIKNRMYVDEFNRGADAKTKDRKLMAVQNAVQSLASMNRDRMMYKAELKKAAAIGGPTGVNERFNQEWEFRKANPGLAPGTEAYRKALADYQLSLADPEAYNQNQTIEQEPQKRGGYRLKRKKQVYG